MSMLLQITARLMLAGWLLLALAGSASGQGIQIRPIGLALTERQPVGSLTLTNRGDRTTTIHAEMHRWTQSRGEDLLKPSRDLLISPPIFSIEPGETQTVRVGLRTPMPKGEEAGYRAIFREVPSSKQTDSAVGLQLILEISIPVFLQPNGFPEPELQWSATLDEQDNQVLLQVRNVGGRHTRVTKVRLTNPDSGATVSGPQQALQYVLPGSQRQWRMPINNRLTRGSTVQIEGKAGRDTINARVRLD